MRIKERRNAIKSMFAGLVGAASGVVGKVMGGGATVDPYPFTCHDMPYLPPPQPLPAIPQVTALPTLLSVGEKFTDIKIDWTKVGTRQGIAILWHAAARCAKPNLAFYTESVGDKIVRSAREALSLKSDDRFPENRKDYDWQKVITAPYRYEYALYEGEDEDHWLIPDAWVQKAIVELLRLCEQEAGDDNVLVVDPMAEERFEFGVCDWRMWTYIGRKKESQDA